MTKKQVAAMAFCAVFAIRLLPAADSTKGFAIRTYYGADHSPDGVGESTRTISAGDIAARDVAVPCAVYYIENTAGSTKGLMVSGTVTSEDGDASNKYIKFVGHPPGSNYFADKYPVTFGGKDYSTATILGFAGAMATSKKKGDYFSLTGSSSFFVEESQPLAGTANAFFGCAWICNVTDGYQWFGEKSDTYPLYVFEVVLAKGTPAGTYKVKLLQWDTDPTYENEVPSPMVEGLDGTVYTCKKDNLTLSDLTIIVEGATPTGPLAGDANCDGQVDLSDAILIRQALANPDKYGVDGSDPTHITAQGWINADVDGETGVTSKDAKQIQERLLDKISHMAQNSGAPALSPGLLGDANCDDHVTLADSVAILQALANPGKYGLTAQGRANADVDHTVVGMSPGDAYKIQQYDAHIITEL